MCDYCIYSQVYDIVYDSLIWMEAFIFIHVCVDSSRTVLEHQISACMCYNNIGYILLVVPKSANNFMITNVSRVIGIISTILLVIIMFFFLQFSADIYHQLCARQSAPPPTPAATPPQPHPPSPWVIQ